MSINGNGDYSGGYTDIYTEAEIQQKIKWFKLTDISVVNTTTQNVLRKFNLIYNNDNNTSSIKSRLALIGLKDNADNGKKYTFTYYPIEELPPYCQNYTDHWGFYNGRNTTEDIASSNYPIKKGTNANYLHYGILNRIDYPTGGYTRFVYEPHRISKQSGTERDSLKILSSDQIVGGLRIKRIYKCPNDNSENEFLYKSYYYTETNDTIGLSSGTLYHIPKYSLIDTSIISIPGQIGFTMYLWSSQSLLPMSSNSYGSHIGYSKVREVNADGSYSITDFTDFDDYPDIPGIYENLNKPFYAPFSSRDYARGKLQLRMEYDSNNQKTRSTGYSYVADKSEFESSIRCINKHVFIIDQLNSFVEKNTYDRFTSTLLLKEINDTVFDNTGLKFITKTRNNYTSRKLLRSRIRTLNSNISERISYKYADDYVDNSPYNKMVENNIVSPIVESITEEGIYDWENKSVIDMDTLSMVRNHYQSDNLLLPQSVDIATNTQIYENRYSYLFNNFKKPVMQITDDSDKTVYVWGYANQYPVAEIKNASIEEVENTIGNLEEFATAETPDFEKLHQLRTDLPNAMVTVCEYIPLVGISVKTEPNGCQYIFEYDNLGRLTVIRDSNGKIIEAYEYNYADE